ncbi:MAG: WD40 repeat domain-containing protein [Gemmataceae bacterium]
MKITKEISIPGIAFALARVPGSSRLLFGSSDFKVYDLDLAASKPEAKALGEHQSYVTGLALAGKTAVSGSYDGRLIWWDIDARKQIRVVEAHTKWIRKVASSPDGKTIASVGDDMVCRLWNAADGKMLRELRGHAEQTPHQYPSMLFVCTFSPDGKFLATADKIGHIVVWEIDDGKPAKTLEAPGMYTWDPVQRKHSIGGTRSLAFSADGKHLAAGGIGKIGNVDHLEGKARIEIFDWRKGEKTHEYADTKFKGLVEHLTFHPKGDWLLGGGGANDGFFLFFDLKEKKAIRQEKASMHVHDFVLDEKAETIYAAGHRKIQMLEVKG